MSPDQGPVREIPIIAGPSAEPRAQPEQWSLRLVASRWWTVALRGLAAIILGLISLFVPGITFLSLVIVFGVYAIVDGVLSLSIGGHTVRDPRWTAGVFRGVVSLVAGVLALFWPGITALVLLLVIGAWALATGVIEIVTAIRERETLRHEWLLALQGVLSVVFGILLFIAPSLGAIVIGLWIGAYALVLGGILLAAGLRLRSVDHQAPANFAAS
jgi:uncharacterized membrane protein HdeD (DUF308 family)